MYRFLANLASRRPNRSHDTTDTVHEKNSPSTQRSTAQAQCRNNDNTTGGQKPPKKKLLKLFLRMLAAHTTALDALILATSTICAIASGCVTPLMSLIFGSLSGSLQQYVAGDASETALRHQLVQVVLYVVYLAIGEFVATYCSTAGFLIAGERITTRIRERYLDAMLAQEIAFFDEVGTGETNTRMTASMNAIQDGISQNVALLLVTVSTSVSGLIIAFARSWLLSLVVLASFVVIAVVLTVGSQCAVKWSESANEHATLASSVADETFESIRTVVSYSIQGRQCEEYHRRLVESRRFGVKAKSALGIMIAVIMLVASLTHALGFWEGARLMSSQNLSVAQIITVLIAMMISALSIGNVAPFLQALLKAMSTAGPIAATIASKKQQQQQSSKNARPECSVQLHPESGSIEFVGVSHAYPMRPDIPVLRDFTLSIPGGSRVAIVGPSGSGKSTLISLLERFYAPSRGRITIDGFDITLVDVRSLRQQLALVSQEPTLFNATIGENIAYGLHDEWADAGSDADSSSSKTRKAARHERVVEAAKTANAHAFIAALPNGYDTVVGERGGLLSGGQRQRIAIARAIVSQPRILLLDEATSALDTASEEVVQAALDNASAGRTTLVIAHRLSTIKTADKIVVLVKGEIAEVGSHAELWQRRGVYHGLVEAQALGSGNAAVREKEEEKENKEKEEQEEQEQDVLEEKIAIVGGSGGAGEVSLEMQKQAFGMEDAASLSDDTQPASAALDTVQAKAGVLSAFKLFGCFDRDRVPLLVGVVSSILAGACQPVQSYLYAVTIAALSKPANEKAEIVSEVSFWAWIYFMMAFLELGIFSLQGVSLARCAENLIMASRERTFEAIVSKPVGFFDSGEHTTGRLTALLASETDHLAACTGATLGTMLRLIAALAGGFLLALIVGWKLALVCIAVIPLSLACGFLRVSMLARLQGQAQGIYQESASYACEALSAIRTVAALTLEQQILGNYQSQLRLQLRRGCRSTLRSSILFALAKAGVLLCAALGFGYGGLLVARHEYSLTQFYTVLSAVIFSAESFGTFFSFAPDLAKSQHAARVLQGIVGSASEGGDDETGAGKAIDERWAGLVEYDKVGFSYPSRREHRVLHRLDLEIAQEKYTAIVGGSGGGKSTIVNLLLRFYSPTQGVIRVDKRNLQSLHVDKYRRKLALVSQEPVLYQGSIASNIELGVPPGEQVSRQRVEEVCQGANIYDFVMSLPSGLDTPVGARGVTLSGGQRQRIAIARALIRQPKLLILDEATSALDSASEGVVLQAIQQAARGRTTIAIAHRLSTVRHADRIYVLDQGRVAERGTHEELMELQGKYFDLVQLQRLD